ncbi:RrF2 family transcriptional regulator [Paenirhodobacter sp.]|uniref:RrF2 family transcriptional regulator n=1 Tax=Paenirhodobacter sp. TaxID=1965326 RepID=UPI003B50FDAA
MYAGACDDRLITIEEAANLYGISRAHLMKVASQLTQAGFLRSVRGRYGGLTLARPASDIRLGDVLRVTEPDFALVGCFSADATEVSACRIIGRCRLTGILAEALQAFMATMDRYTLADVMLSPEDFGLSPAA